MAQPKVDQLFEEALHLHGSGHLDAAKSLYEQIVTRKPNHAGALHSLGIIAIQRGDFENAIELIRRAVSYKSDYPEAYNNLGTALRSAGQLSASHDAYRQAIALRANYPEAHNNLGVCLKQSGRLDEAIASYRQAIAQRPSYADAFYNLGNALVASDNAEEAVTAYQQAILHRPAYPQALSNLANACQIIGRLDEAVAAAQAALKLNPNYPQAVVNLGSALQARGELDQAIAMYRQAIALLPQFAEAHRNLAFALLARGEFAEGWAEYEWRWKCEDFPSPKRDFPAPVWNGEDLTGKTILVYTEQGLGDAMQIARFIPLVARRCGRVFVECQPSLTGLMKTVEGASEVFATNAPLPAFDFVIPLMSLPHMLGNTLETLPQEVPYFHPPAERVAAWRDRITAYDGYKIGIVWKGKRKPTPLRSCSLSDLAPLAAIPDVVLFSLQVGEGLDELANPPAGMNVIDLGRDFTDFVETAACVANLDLIVTIDTSMAHLAGAMGRSTFTLLPVSPDWRWMFERSDSPWYPTMRLFRQRKLHDWTEAVAEMAEEIGGLSEPEA